MFQMGCAGRYHGPMDRKCALVRFSSELIRSLYNRNLHIAVGYAQSYATYMASCAARPVSCVLVVSGKSILRSWHRNLYPTGLRPVRWMSSARGEIARLGNAGCPCFSPRPRDDLTAGHPPPSKWPTRSSPVHMINIASSFHTHT